MGISELLEDILDFAKVSILNGKVPSGEMADLDQIAHQAISNLGLMIKEKNAKVKIIDTLPPYRINRSYALLLFQNLIDNAIKYNVHQLPEVKISARIKDKQLFLIFEDNGIGIDPEAHQKIFEMFSRLDGQQSASGNGMGLAICQKIVRKYQGVIELDSESGHGTTFTIKLPINECPTTIA